MHGAHFDPGGSAGKGLLSPGKTSLAAAHSALGLGAAAVNPGCQCPKTLIPGVVMGSRGSHVLPLCPLPLPVCVYFLFLSVSHAKILSKIPCELAWAVLPPGAGSVLLTDFWQLHLLLLPLLHPPNGMFLAPSPADVLETRAFSAVPAMVLPQRRQSSLW